MLSVWWLFPDWQGPYESPGPLWARPLWPLQRPCGPSHCKPSWALVGRALVGPLGPCGSALVGPPGPLWAGSLVGRRGSSWAVVAPPGPFWARPLQALLGPLWAG